MYDPFSNNGASDGSNNNSNNNTENGYSYRPDSADHAPGQTFWQGDCYHSYRDPGTPTPDGGGEKPPYYDVTPQKPKKHGKHFRTAGKILAGALAVFVISAGSIAGFAALVNSGKIRLNTDGASPAFTIVKNSDSKSSSAAVTNTAATGTLTPEEVAKKVVPSVVCIQNFQISQKSDFIINGFGDGTEGNSNNNSSGSTKTGISPTSEGSGIIASSDGYIVTNAHVVNGASSLKVILSSGKTYSAKLIGSDSITDLAVIKINASGLTAAQFGSSSDLKVADKVMAIGNPGGLEFNSSVTVGYVSALNRQITNSDTGYTMKCIQTDAAINPGNSGGALVNMKGQVVGINSSKIVATGYEGLGFAIPINEAQPVVSELKAYGYVKDRAVLGISGQYIDSMTARMYGLPTGMYVAAVNSNAVSDAGIRKGDVITKIDGTEVTSMNTITSLIASKKPGNVVTLTVSRSLTGKTFTASVKLSQATGK